MPSEIQKTYSNTKQRVQQATWHLCTVLPLQTESSRNLQPYIAYLSTEHIMATFHVIPGSMFSSTKKIDRILH